MRSPGTSVPGGRDVRLFPTMSSPGGAGTSGYAGRNWVTTGHANGSRAARPTSLR